MKCLILALVLLNLIPPPVHAQEPATDDATPATQPAEDKMGPGPIDDPRTRGFGPPGSGRRRGWGGEMSESDWQEAAAFMRANSPRRWQMFESLPEDSQRRRPVMRMVIARYRNLRSLQDEDPAMYDVRLNQLKLEDQIFGLSADLRNAPEEGRQPILQQIHTAVAQSVDLWMQERQRRIERLEQSLREQKERLEQDKANRESIVADRVEKEINRPKPGMGHGE